jgi:hypothetical protein
MLPQLAEIAIRHNNRSARVTLVHGLGQFLARPRLYIIIRKLALAMSSRSKLPAGLKYAVFLKTGRSELHLGSFEQFAGPRVEAED